MFPISNSTSSFDGPQWHSKPAWKLPGWAEPLIVASILFGAMFMTRKRGYRILDQSPRSASMLDLCDSDANSSMEKLIGYDSDSDASADALSTARFPHKRRNCCGFRILTPNTSRFKDNLHSRVLQRFPFLIEMFYWIINYAFYRMTSITSQRMFAKTGIWNVAEEHGIKVLEVEQTGVVGVLFPVGERAVQQWFMSGHQDALTVLNKVYALIHIPGTVGFICWYYYVAPSHSTFAVARRTITLTNFCAFLTFVFYPCMPPRLLPEEYGFLDTVRHDNAQSVWMSGKYVNTLAAMPSMHFGYAFCIGCTLVYHSGLIRRKLERGETRKNPAERLFYILLGMAYPLFILVTIVATANHYWLDAVVATAFAFLSFACNKIFYVFLPVEDWLLWAIRAEKPVPTTGEQFWKKENRGRSRVR